MCHLRLQAACCILKIAQVRQYRDLFTPLLYLELAMMVNVIVPQLPHNWSSSLSFCRIQNWKSVEFLSTNFIVRFSVSISTYHFYLYLRWFHKLVTSQPSIKTIHHKQLVARKPVKNNASEEQHSTIN